MATNGDTQATVAPVLAALATLQANVEQAQKNEAHEYLQQFQKSPQAWTSTYSLLESPQATVEAKMFAATTLKGKIIYDLHQLPRANLMDLRNSLLNTLRSATSGPKPIRTQLCVSLANLAIQLVEWKDVLQLVVNALGSDPHSVACMLEFLHVLPEEVTEGRKINLSEDELATRTNELILDNAPEVFKLLNQYAQSSSAAAKNPQMLECVTSWMKEIPVQDVVQSPLLDVIFQALGDSSCFDAAVECLSAVYRETNDVGESSEWIRPIYSRLIALRPMIKQAAEAEDSELLRGFTRVFTEAAEAWVVLIAKVPHQYKPLVESVLECAARDQDREAISLTFNFWYQLKQMLVVETYMESRLQYAGLFENLIDVMIHHLEYPKPEDGDETDLFDGDREQEERFRQFRHEMGDVLKDCCSVLGPTECLKKPYALIENWATENRQAAQQGQLPNWQAIEAPLFGMRAMGKQIPSTENIMLPRLMPLIIDIPDHEKVRFQAIMVLGRYTAWTANHPDTLKAQLDFIMGAFDYKSPEVVNAAALSFNFFCIDCASLLKDFVTQVQQFYCLRLEQLSLGSQEEITNGAAAILAEQSTETMYSAFKLYCDPNLEKLKSLADRATDKPSQLRVADRINLITIFFERVVPSVNERETNPAVQYCQEIFPVLAKLTEAFPSVPEILERVCRCWRFMVFSYRSAMAPLLQQLAHSLSAGFSATRHGCFLWAADAIVREMSEGAESVDSQTSGFVFQLVEELTKNFLHALSDSTPEQQPDLIEDFFKLEADVIFFFPQQALTSNLMAPILRAANASLTLLKEEPLRQLLHFLRDLLLMGTEDGPAARRISEDVRNHVKHLLMSEGESLTRRIVTGQLYSFPYECQTDGAGVLADLGRVLPEQTMQWLGHTLGMLPEGSITSSERERLQTNAKTCVDTQNWRRLGVLLQDFTNSFRRRNVAPREGLGRLEAGRFRYSG